MKLSTRIRHLVRANLASPRRSSSAGRTTSPGQMEKQLEQIRKSLVQAAARENRLTDALALAEKESRGRDANRLRRELSDLTRSADELQAALALIEAQIEMELESGVETSSHPPTGASSTVEEAQSPQAALADAEEEADLAARKARLSTLDNKPGATAEKSR